MLKMGHANVTQLGGVGWFYYFNFSIIFFEWVWRTARQTAKLFLDYYINSGRKITKDHNW